MDEEQARAFLDANGYLRSALEPLPATTSTFLVFSQASSAALDVGVWQRQATRFFETRLGLAIAKASGNAHLEHDAYLLLVEPPSSPIARRLLVVRPRTPDDLHLAEQMDAAHGSRGMSDLAARCERVCLIEAEGGDDRAALVLAAIAASILLGPIVPPSRDAIYGVRTAREKLSELSKSVYR